MPKIDSGQQVGVTDSKLDSAASACQDLWPYRAPSQGQQGQELTEAVKFAQCMRSHGLPTWPDPTIDSQSGRVQFVISASKDGITTTSPQVMAKAHTCEKGIPANMLPGSANGVEVTTTS
jgi:hypothetical protein